MSCGSNFAIPPQSVEIPRPVEQPQRKPRCLRDDALAVLNRLRQAKHVAYFAGGCVRDMLLGLDPSDYDIATSAPPPEVRRLFPITQAVGAAFGVILVRHGRSVVEVATFRSEGKYSDGRRPDEVHFTSAEEDARRRDFTINGLFFDPVENKVIDFVDGQQDLAARRLRAIGDPERRFNEDHLRLLRAVRFAARFALSIDPPTGKAILSAAPFLKGISPERIAEELRLILPPPSRRLAWPMLWEYHLAHVIFRLVPLPENTAFDPRRSLFMSLSPDNPIRFDLALAAALLDVHLQTHPATDPRTGLARTQVVTFQRAMRQGLRLSNDESEAMEAMLVSLAPLLADTPPTLAMKKRFLARLTADASRRLLEALTAIGFFRERIASLDADFHVLADQDCAPPPLVTGDDLTAAGLSPGPSFKRALDATYDAQLEGTITTKAEALALATNIADG
jgi:poly(A) polymerase